MTTSKFEKYERYRDNYLSQILEIKPDFQRYYNKKLKHLKIQTQINNLKTLLQFFLLVKKFTPEGFENYFASDKFIAYNNITKNTYSNIIEKWALFNEIDYEFERYKKEHNEINKNELITRSELQKILKKCSVKKRALIMVNYECALRRKELINIRFKDIQYNEDEKEFNLYIIESKTIKRNMAIGECLPFLREYFSMNDFEPNDLIFDYTPEYLGVMYNRIAKRAGIDKRFYPHILRHSRLTELALTVFNEPQLRKFAGWSRSSAMASVYFHIDDSDIRKILYGTNDKEIKLIDFENPIDDVLKLRESQISELTNKILVMDKNFDEILKTMDIKEKQINELEKERSGLSKAVLEITEILKENKESLTDKQKEKLRLIKP